MLLTVLIVIRLILGTVVVVLGIYEIRGFHSTGASITMSVLKYSLSLMSLFIALEKGGKSNWFIFVLWTSVALIGIVSDILD